MNKAITYIFSAFLIIGMIITCAVGVRPIGKDLYKCFTNLNDYSGLEKADSVITTIDNAFTENFFIRSNCIDMYGLIQKTIGKEIIVDSDPLKTVIKGDNNSLYFQGNVTGDYQGDDTLKSNKESVVDLYSFCKDNDINFVFASAPHKYKSDSVELPIDVNNMDDYSEDSASFVKQLRENGIPALDLMSDLSNEYKDYSDGFFKTDHHWNIKTAFWGYSKICEKLNENSDNSVVDSKYYDINCYNVKTYKNSFLGSMGVRTGKFYVGKDDVDLISPRFKTSFKIEYKTKTLGNIIKREGNFETAIINGDVSYGMYLTSDNSHIRVDNKLNDNGHKVLFLKDSFGIPVSAWLATWSHELHILDLRYQQEKSVKSIINDNDIDTVIILYNPEMLRSKVLYNFSTVSNGY